MAPFMTGCPAAALAVVHWQHLLLELGVQGFNITGIGSASSSPPMAHPVTPSIRLDPPAVEHTQVRHTVERRLHSLDPRLRADAGAC